MNIFSTYFTLDFGFFLAILNVAASYITCNTDFEIKSRKQNQFIIIWLIPFFGSFLAIYLNRETWFKKGRPDETNNPSDITDTPTTTYASVDNSE